MRLTTACTHCCLLVTLGQLLALFVVPLPCLCCSCQCTKVSDISQLGDVAAVSELVLPRGSTLLASTTQQVPQPPKETPLGQVDMPPQNYYM